MHLGACRDEAKDDVLRLDAGVHHDRLDVVRAEGLRDVFDLRREGGRAHHLPDRKDKLVSCEGGERLRNAHRVLVRGRCGRNDTTKPEQGSSSFLTPTPSKRGQSSPVRWQPLGHCYHRLGPLDPALAARVEQAMESGERIGVGGTPSLFIDGIRYRGARDQAGIEEP